MHANTPLIETSPRPGPSPLRADEWRLRRIGIGGAFGVWFAGTEWILDFWPLSRQPLRAFVDLSRLFLVLPIAGFILGLLIAASVALWRHHIRRALSSVLAIAALPACFTIVAMVTLFDPWLWYALANMTHFEMLAANGSTYAVLDEEDVSTGFAGLNPNHFVFLVYDTSDDIGREPSQRPAVWQTRTVPGLGSFFPKARRLYGHVFRVDVFD